MPGRPRGGGRGPGVCFPSRWSSGPASRCEFPLSRREKRQKRRSAWLPAFPRRWVAVSFVGRMDFGKCTESRLLTACRGHSLCEQLRPTRRRPGNDRLDHRGARQLGNYRKRSARTSGALRSQGTEHPCSSRGFVFGNHFDLRGKLALDAPPEHGWHELTTFGPRRSFETAGAHGDTPPRKRRQPSASALLQLLAPAQRKITAKCWPARPPWQKA